jgi:hypothetical protein
LQSVNLSDDVAINLTIKEDKKYIINGQFNLGLGWGEEWKGAMHANVFSISKQSKVLLLSDNGNTGTHYDFSSVGLIYDELMGEDIKRGNLNLPSFLQERQLRNPGVPSPFIDNGLSRFASLRSSYDLHQDWNLQLNGTAFKKNDTQTLLEQTSFSFNRIQSYRLSLTQKEELKDIRWQGDMQVNYLSPDQSRSLNVYAEWRQSSDHGMQTITEGEGGFSVRENIFRQRQEKLLLSSLYTQKVNDYSVAQFQMKFERARLPEWGSFVNRDLLDYFQLDSTAREVQQRLAYTGQGTEVLSRFFHKKGTVTFKVEPRYAIKQVQSENQLWAQDSTPSVSPVSFPGAPSSNNILLHTYGVNTHLRQQWGDPWIFDFYTSLSQNRINLPEDRYILPAALARVRLTRSFAQNKEATLTYAIGRQEPDAIDFFTLPYLRDAYTIYQPMTQDTLNTQHKITFSLRSQNDIHFRNYFFSVNLFNRSTWRESAFFQNSVLLGSPFFSRDNQGFNVTGHFTQYLPGIRTNVKMGGGWMLSQHRNLFQEIESQINVHVLRGQLELRTLLGKQLHFIAKNNYTLFSTYSSVSEGELVRTWNWNTRLETLYKNKAWAAALVVQRNTSNRRGNNHLVFYTTQFKLTRAIMFFKKKATIELLINNLADTRAFERVSGSDAFIFQSSVEAIPRFFVVKMDIGF